MFYIVKLTNIGGDYYVRQAILGKPEGCVWAMSRDRATEFTSVQDAELAKQWVLRFTKPKMRRLVEVVTVSK